MFFPGGPRGGRTYSVVLSSLQCSSLSHVMGTCCPWRLPLVASRWGSSLCQRLLFAPCSRRRLLSWLSSLRLRVFRSFWISPLYFPDCGFAYMATCAALHVSRFSFVLGEFSFWLGFGLCLTILLAPWGYRRAYCGPHCGRESARVLASLLGPSPSGVRQLSRVCSSVGGPVGVAHSFHPSLLLGGVLVRLCSGPC